MSGEDRKFQGTMLVGPSPVPASAPAPSDRPIPVGTMIAGTPSSFPNQAPAPTNDPAQAPITGAPIIGVQGTMQLSSENMAEVQARIAAAIQQKQAAAAAQAAPTAPPMGVQGTMQLSPENMAEVQARVAAAIQQKRAAEAAQAAARQPGDVASYPPPSTHPPPVVMAPPYAAPVQPQPVPSVPPQPMASAPPMVQEVPKKKSSALIYVLVGGVVFFLGLVVLGAIGVFAYSRYAAQATSSDADGTVATTETTPTETQPPAPTDPAVAAATTETATAETATTETGTNAGEVPSAAGSAVADAPAATEEEVEPNVMLTCSPACATLDAISCDREKVTFARGGIRLEPGKHDCVFYEPQYSALRVAIKVPETGKIEQSVTLKRRVTGRPEPCGTFINPCE
ncbi:MAG: hypothetical protein JW751_16505 [Polyangiaceae bacterium]|nr:hypothetical protein [Polyangiaceae bacterium]